MAKMVLGKTPKELEAERAKRAREQEAEIQQSVLERQKKIQALHAKQKTNKIIIGLLIFIVAAVFVTFGTYNTFFKKGLSMDEVNMSIAQNIQTFRFPSEGLDNYVRDNCSNLFIKYMSLDGKRSKNVASVDVDENSCYIFKVRKLNAQMAEVYFSVDVKVTEKDTQVTDPVILEQLKKNGFGDLKSSAAPQQPQEVQQPEVTEEVNEVPEEVVEESVDEVTDDEVIDNADGEVSDDEVTEEVTTEAPTEAPTEEPTTESDVPITDIDYSDGSTGEAVHYYMTGNGVVMQSGKVTTTRYSFYIPVYFKYTYDADGTTIKFAGYELMSDMNLYSLVEENQSNFDEIAINEMFTFNEEAVVDEDTLHDIQIRVDKTLDSLYGYKNTEAEYKLYLQFNTYDASYNGITEFESYKEPNAMGYNTRVTYSITTPQGFTYTLKSYMLVEPDGNSWVIKKIM